MGIQLRAVRKILPPRNARAAEVARLQALVFGSAENTDGPHTSHLRKPLLAQQHARWYPPSKYMHLDFRLEQYLAMQAQRYSRRPLHPCVPQLRRAALQCRRLSPRLRSFFNSLASPELIRNHPTLSDLAAFVRYVDKAGQENNREGTVDDGLSRTQLPAVVQYRAPSAENDCYVSERVLSVADKYFLENRRGRKPQAVLAKPHRAPCITQSVTFHEPLERLTLGARVRGEQRADRARAVLKRYVTESEFKTRALSCIKLRRRFIDPLYRRKRFSFLNGKMKEKKKRPAVLVNRHYRIHPDMLLQYPSHKGATFIRYPSVHK